MDDYIKKFLPKADCHVHANGMTTNQDVLRLARKHNVDLSIPHEERGHLTHICSDGSRIWAEHGFSPSHEAYDQTVSLVRIPEDLHDVVLDALIKQGKDNCLYARLLSSGLNNCRREQDVIPTFENNMLALIAAIDKARAETGIEATISVSAKRHLKNGPVEAHRLLDACDAFLKKYPEHASVITGFDMAGDEKRGRCRHFEDVFARATTPRDKGGVGLVGSCHAGEILNVSDIKEAMALPGVTSLAHILSAAGSQDIRRAIRQQGLFIDQLLISNSMLHDINPSEHLIHDLRKEKLWFGLGSDDPGLQNTTIADEYVVAARDYHFTMRQLLERTIDTVVCSSLLPERRETLLKRIKTFVHEHGLALRSAPPIHGERPRYNVVPALA